MRIFKLNLQLDKGKYKELAAALADLLDNPKKLSDLSKAGQDGVTRNFNLHNQALETIEIYTKILAKKNKDSDVA